VSLGVLPGILLGALLLASLISKVETGAVTDPGITEQVADVPSTRL
jgi:hypothetical protein